MARYKDVPNADDEDEDDPDDDDNYNHNEVHPSGSSGGIGIASGIGGLLGASPNSYSSIIQQDHDEEDPMQNVTVPRRRRPPTLSLSSSSSSSTCCSRTCLWMTLWVFIILAVAAWVTWRVENELHPEGLPFHPLQFGTTNADNATAATSTTSRWGERWWFHRNKDENDMKSSSTATTTATTTTTTKAAKSKPIPTGNQALVHYNPDAALHYYNPFDFTVADWYGSVAVPPPLLQSEHDDTSTSTGKEEEKQNETPTSTHTPPPLGFYSQPNIVDSHLLFVTEGDVYYTNLNTTSSMAAFKLTTTVGNVRSPTFNPVYPYFVAFTATYTGHREVYVMDMRPSYRSQPAMRLTYWDTSYGVNSIIGWKDHGMTLVFSAMSRDVGLPDTRLYQIALQQQQKQTSTTNDRDTASAALQVLQISPIPLSQAIDGVWKDDCLFFTRYQQSSNTVRYVGGTAESLWAWCEGESEAVPLTSNYRGTSKRPKIATVHGVESLLFLSDRDTTTGAIPATMNLFSVPLPTKSRLYQKGQGGADATTNLYTIQQPQALTQVSCQYGGLALQEYSVDGANNNAVLRIGADLYLLSLADKSGSIQKLDIVVYSDFHEHQERLLPVSVLSDMTAVDIYTTSFGATAALLGMRGQLFVAPVLPNAASSSSYAGSGMNIPPRRYRVVPGTTTGGVVRVLNTNFVPMPQENGKTTRRLAVILATDPHSPTAEHAFYLIETQSDSAPSFVDRTTLPQPFLGGDSSTQGGGGSVANGGLGSVAATSIRVSPCGRRMAWTDTDGRICVMTMPMYQSNSTTTTTNGAPAAAYQVLPTVNENGEPMMGIDVDLSWSPGGRYLVVNHAAKNQFLILSIVDCGDPNMDGTDEVADITIGRIVQATPARFNSESPYWGKTGMDIALAAQTATFASLSGQRAPKNDDGATTLYFLSDRDVISDVGSPWGTRAPSPHFMNRKSVYALPLVTVAESPMNPMHGIYAGGGAAELWADGIIDLQLQLDALEATAASSTKPKGGRRLTQNHLLAAAAAASARDLRTNRRAIDFEPETVSTQAPVDLTVQENADDASGNTKSPSPSTISTDQTIPTVELAATTGPSLTPTAALPASKEASPSPSPSTSPPTSLPATKEVSPSPLSSTPTSVHSSEEISPSPSTRPPTSLQTSKASPSPSTIVPINPTGIPTKSQSAVPSTAPSSQAEASPVFPNDLEIDFGSGVGLSFARKAYRIAGIPAGAYTSILCQLKDDPSLILIQSTDKGTCATLMATEDFPSDKIDSIPLYGVTDYMGSGLSTTRNHIIFILAPGLIKVVANKAASVMKISSDTKIEENIVDTADMAVSIWPQLEYEQMFNDAWRMLRDYFYDTNMNGVNWVDMHGRYKGLVKRCSKREELDDVLAQMSAELSALHVFVYGGEYNDPMHGDDMLRKLHEVASLGATFERSAEFKGYIVKSIAHRDPDFNLMDGTAVYSPLSNQVLELSGQRGLEVGDVIVGVNGESVMRVPDLHLLLRGTAGRSVRLDVIRQPKARLLANGTEADFKPEPVITVPLTQKDADNVRYAAWEWNTQQAAKSLAADKGFSVGYVHLRSMEGPEDIDAFTRGFFADYDKQALIIDVRHNHGGNIDSWLLDVLQRRAWMYWQGRATNIQNGGLGWDQQFAFRGHVVVLIDEKSSSDAEGFSRGFSELGLGRLVGTRTWGGGIWLSSDNHLVDGGIATAPEIGTYNDHFGWGLGIEQQGVEPDILVDNNPRIAFDGTDQQLEKAIDVLAQWLLDEPIVQPKAPLDRKDMSLKANVENCPVKK